MEFETVKDLLWAMNKPSSTKERKETGILRFFKCFSRMWQTGKIYKADKIEKKNCSNYTAFSYLLNN